MRTHLEPTFRPTRPRHDRQAHQSPLLRVILPDVRQVLLLLILLPAFSGTAPMADEVPLPATPDWQGTLERAVGGLAWGDADGDGDLDLAVGCYYANAYPPITEWKNYIYSNVGGTLESLPSWTSADERSTADVRWADLDGDGRPDLIAANGYDNLAPSVIYFNGPGGVATTPGWTAADATWTLGAAAADVDDDGDLDVAFANQGRSLDPYRPVSLFYNTGSTLETSPTWTSADPAISNVVAWGDVDGLGRTARSALFTGDGARRVFHVALLPLEEPVRVSVDGIPVSGFAWERIAGWVSLPSAPPPGAAVVVGYYNSTTPDLAVSRWTGFASGIYHNTGGSLESLPGWTVADEGRSEKGIGWADVDNDGDLDLAIGASSDATRLYANQGTGLDATPVWQAQAAYFGCQDLAWGDVDADGDLDLATVHFGNGHARVYLNEAGTLTDEPCWFYDCSSSATAIAWGDMNGDGRLDLAVGTARQPPMVFLNTLPPAGIAEHSGILALQLILRPQPWRAPGRIGFRLPPGSEGRLSIHDPTGRCVRWLPLGSLRTGSRGIDEIDWNGRDGDGHRLPAGVYLVRLQAADQQVARPLLLVAP
ncbi:MAG: VCBS repeat-containing protein [Candidatus Eisenbacteria sp.]|nr:VCBS repeat-containing protein [Candidatus Eisenbacteria bacterium]